LVPRIAGRDVVAAGRGAVGPLHEKTKVALDHGREEHHQRRPGQRLYGPAPRGVLDRDHRKGDLNPPDLFSPSTKHVAAAYQPVLIDLGLPTLLADHRDALRVGPQRFGGVAQVEAGGAILDAPVDFVDVTQEQRNRPLSAVLTTGEAR